jgi:aspartate carbamoyltransferase regulatory subunit
MALWNRFVPFFTEISGHNNDFEKVKKGMSSYINQIHKIDPSSVAFRYERSKNQQKCNLEEVKHINIFIFCQNMEKLTDLLDGISCEFEVALDYTYEMRSLYRDF